MQSTAKGARRHITCVMVEKEQANPAHRRIRVAERSHLHGGDRHLLADPRSAFPRECSPSTDEIICDLKVGSHLTSISRAGRQDVAPDAVDPRRPPPIQRCMGSGAVQRSNAMGMRLPSKPCSTPPYRRRRDLPTILTPCQCTVSAESEQFVQRLRSLVALGEANSGHLADL